MREQQQLEGQPATRAPQQVVGRPERVQEPDEACVGPAGAAGGAEGAWRKATEAEGWGVGRAPAKVGARTGADPGLSSWSQAPRSHEGCLGPQSPPLQLFVFGKHQEEHLTQLGGAFPGRGAALLYRGPCSGSEGGVDFGEKGRREEAPLQ